MKKFVFAVLIAIPFFASAGMPLDVKLSRNLSDGKEIIRVNVKNSTNNTVQFLTVSIEQLDNSKWGLLAYDISCPCLAKCHTVGYTLEPHKELNLVFDLTKLGCGQLAKGVQYRAIAQGGWDAAINTRTMLGESKSFLAKE
ncbi:hypothetical protein ACO0LF_14815 [Undibacterium sp. Di27W]|uniref:hypothetical protein n=1 Tax=Undibacterium sp. Di27W TaxID=3413036 RepID=UPI003BF077FC